MKPLLVIPPAPERWKAVQDLLGHKGPLWLEDIELRIKEGVPDSRDAFAVVANGGQLVANTCINRRDDLGLLGHVFTRPEFRGRGLAHEVMRTALAWFDMTGGKWAFLGCRAELVPRFQQFGFDVLHRVTSPVMDDVTMCRRARGVGDDPLPASDGEVQIADVTRADWPLLVALLQYRPGADPRVEIATSAVAAELTGLDLLSQQQHGRCHLLAAKRAGRIVALASLSTEKADKRTYAVILPHDEPPAALRAAVQREAEARNYERVEFPMEALSR